MTLRILDLADGFSSATQPDSSAIDVNRLVSYANDAEYESNHTSEEGSIYYNTTDDSVRVYDGSNWSDIGGGGALYTETPIGIVNGVNTDFTVTFAPLNDVVVPSVNGRTLKTDEYSYSGGILQFTVAPVVSQELSVFYLYNGSASATPIAPSQDFVVYPRTITGTDISNKKFTLPSAPNNITEVIASLKAATPIFVGDDFEIINSNEFSWDSLGLDGDIEIGDKIQVIYFTS